MGTAALSHAKVRWPDPTPGSKPAASACGLIERDDHLARLDTLLDDCRAFRGGAVVIGGGVAAGKTALLHAFGARAARAGATVLEAFGSPAERDVPLGVLRQWFDRGPGALTDRPDGSSAQPRSHLLQHMCVTLRALSEQAPVVLLLDDVHLADPASLRGMAYLGRRLESARVLLIATELDDPAADPVRDAWQTDLLRQPRCHRMRVGPLSVDGVAEALILSVGTATAREAAPAWRDLTGGNPLLIRALIEDRRSAAGTAPLARPEPGEAFAKAVLTSLHHGGELLVNVARAVAVLPESGPATFLPRLLDADEGHAKPIPARALEALETAGVLRAGRFRHPAARAAVLADFAGPDQAALRRRAAGLLHSAGAPADEVAVHLVAAGHADEPWALDVLRHAAETALARDDGSFALECLRLAGPACPDEDARVEVALTRARVEWRVNPGAALRHVQPLIPALRQGRLPGAHAIALIKLLLWHGLEDEATDGLRGLEEARDHLDARSQIGIDSIYEFIQSNHPPLAARIPARVPGERGGTRPGERGGTRPGAPGAARSGSFGSGSFASGSFESGPLGSEGVAAAAKQGPLMPAVTALSEVLSTGAGPATVRTAEWVLQATPLDDVTLGSLEWAMLALVYADRPDLAAPWCDQFLREAAARRAPTWQAMLSGVRAEIAVHQGDPRAAEQHARTALTVIPAWTWGVGIGRPLSALLSATTATATPVPAQLATPIPDAMFQTRFGLQYLYARGQQRLAHGRLHAALDDLLICGRLMTEWDVDLPAFVPWRVEAALALVGLGRADEARSLARDHLARPGGARVRGMGLRALAAAGETRERATVLRSAVDLLQEGGDGLQLAYALADLSDAHRAAGDPARARMIARRASRLAQDCSAEPLRRRLAEESGSGAEAGPTPGSGPGPDPQPWSGDGGWPARRVDRAPAPGGPRRAAGTLSAAESQVAMLAASGRTNREIATKLYITISTVEQHLTHVYRKLRVNGRADLPSTLHG